MVSGDQRTKVVNTVTCYRGREHFSNAISELMFPAYILKIG
jgi:hypothetical protein